MINHKTKYKVIVNNFFAYNKNEMVFETLEEAKDCFDTYTSNNNAQEVSLLEYDQFVGWSVLSTANKELLID